MKTRRPATVEQYTAWLGSEFRVDLGSAYEKYYQRACDRLLTAWTKAPSWLEIRTQLTDWEDLYQSRHAGYGLLMGKTPELHWKPFKSFVEKTFRKNVIDNAAWPEPPAQGWFLPDEWLFRVNDVVRTELIVKYLDGARFLADNCCRIAESQGARSNQWLEARDEGYYAIHVYLRQPMTLPASGSSGAVDGIGILELQITTQLKDTIRRLTHVNYERRRMARSSQRKWQLQLGSDEFVGNYVGHMMHFMEGMILEVRDKQLEEPSTAERRDA